MRRSHETDELPSKYSKNGKYGGFWSQEIGLGERICFFFIYIISYMTLTQDDMFSFFDHISGVCGSIWTFSSQFCQLEFDKEAISDGCRN